MFVMACTISLTLRERLQIGKARRIDQSLLHPRCLVLELADAVPRPLPASVPLHRPSLSVQRLLSSRQTFSVPRTPPGRFRGHPLMRRRQALVIPSWVSSSLMVIPGPVSLLRSPRLLDLHSLDPSPGHPAMQKLRCRVRLLSPAALLLLIGFGRVPHELATKSEIGLRRRLDLLTGILVVPVNSALACLLLVLSLGF